MRHGSRLREFVPIFLVLRFHLGEKLNELWRLTDAIQTNITGVAGIKVKTGDRRFSQPFDGFRTLPFERIDAGDVVSGMMIERALRGMPAEDDRDHGFCGLKIAF